MAILNDDPDVGFKLGDKIPNAVKGTTAEERLYLRTSTGDDEINRVSHVKFHRHGTSEEFERFTLTMDRVENINVLLRTVESNAVSSSPSVDLLTRGVHFTYDLSIRDTDRECFEGREIVRKEGDLPICGRSWTRYVVEEGVP